MTHPKQDIKLVEILQASCLQRDVLLRNLLVHTLWRFQEEELKLNIYGRRFSGNSRKEGLRDIAKRALKSRTAAIPGSYMAAMSESFYTECAK